LASAAVPAVPADSDAVALRPAFDSFSDFVQDARDLVPGHARIDDPGHEALFRENVAVADPVGLDPAPPPPRSRDRDLPLDRLERPSRPGHLNRAHLRQGLLLSRPP